MNPSPLARALTAATAALAVGALAACGSGGSGSGAGTSIPAPSTPSSTAAPSGAASSAAPGASPTTTQGIAPGEDKGAAQSNDIMFAQMMIPHHEQALTMADLALSAHGASAKVQEIAQRIKGEQAPEIATMKGWLAQWKAPEKGSDMAMPGMLGDAELKALSAAQGPAFDSLWLKDMIAHHSGAVEMAEGVLKTTQNADVKAFANGVIAAQTKDVAEMKKLVG